MWDNGTWANIPSPNNRIQVISIILLGATIRWLILWRWYHCSSQGNIGLGEHNYTGWLALFDGILQSKMMRKAWLELHHTEEYDDQFVFLVIEYFLPKSSAVCFELLCSMYIRQLGRAWENTWHTIVCVTGRSKNKYIIHGIRNVARFWMSCIGWNLSSRLSLSK